MRIKTVNYDGSIHSFGELTVKQVDDLFGVNGDGDRKKAVLIDVVCVALNNATAKDAPESEKWTRARCAAEMGGVECRLLFADILAYSEITLAQGEVPAATSTISSNSAAA